MKRKECIQFLTVAGLLGVLLFLSAAQPVGAQAPAPNGPTACTAGQTRYRSTFTSIKDSYVKDTAPDMNYGTNAGMVVGIVTGLNAAVYHSLIAFDLSALPDDAVILTATLEVYQNSGTGFTIKAQALTAPFTETTVTWNTEPSFTTVDEVVEGIAVNGWEPWDLTPIVQKWRAGTLPNHGLRLIFNFGANGSRVFSAREGAHPPRLVVEYVRRVTLSPLADTYVVQSHPTTNYGGYDTMSVRYSASDAQHTLLRFDPSGIPAGSTVISAALELHSWWARTQAPAAPQAIDLAPEAVLASWSEMAVTWNTAPASESQGDPAKSWPGHVVDWLDVTHIAEAWVSGALLNHGVKIKGTTGDTNAIVYSREAGETLRPKLIITYGPPPCYAVESVVIGGATQGITDTQYTFDATIAPVTATTPITYTWEATDQTSHTGPQEDVEYAWNTPGWKTITVTVANCESTITDTHLVSITIPAPTCEFPLTGLGLIGPGQGVTDTSYTFTATLAPAAPTPPYTLTWEADDQPITSGQQATVAFSWNAPGVKHITVTAENCGGVFVQYHTFTVIPRDQLPDLHITSLWYNLDEQRIYYIVKNTGGSAAPAGFAVALTKAITEVLQTPFPEALQPGWVRAGTIDYEWGCAEYPPGTTALRVLVTADAGDTVLEGDEANNAFEEWWLCDMYPPEIIAGPTFTSLTEHTAVITWTTDKPVRSYFDYGRSGPFNTATLSNTNYRTEHQVSLSDLSNASTYWYKIRLTDHEGLLNATDGDYFETMPPGTDPITLGAFGMTEYPSTLYEFYTLYADVASDVEGVDRVAFFLDEQLIGHDVSPTGSRYEVYVSPAALGLTRAQWFTGHALQVQAYNLEQEVTADVKTVTPPARPMPGKALLLTPGSGHPIYVDGSPVPAGTTINSAIYGAQYRWACTSNGYSEGSEVPPGLSAISCDDVRESVDAMRLYLDGALVETYTPPADVENYWFTVDLSGKSIGDHILRFDVQTTEGNTISSDEVTLTLVRGQADLEFGRTATRSGNAIQVTLRITNTGTGTAYVDYIEDVVRGFQVIEDTNTPGRLAPTATDYTIKNGDYAETPARLILIDMLGSGGEAALDAGDFFAITYRLVPILYPTPETYSIGSGGAGSPYLPRIHYRHPSGTAHAGFEASSNLVDGVYVDTVVQQIAAASDTILVTSPLGLVMYTGPSDWRADWGVQRELSMLLSKMAELATLRNGILGYLPISPCPTTLDALLQRGGYWYEALHANFRAYHAGGYVLFVGEDEVIPPQAAGYDVPYSDLRYASTSGQAKPELVLGRIAGPDLGTLRQGIEASIAAAHGNGFDRQRAVLNSGRSDGEGEFWTQINEINDRLNFPYVTRLRWKNLGNTPEILPAIKAEMALGQSLVAYRGHGGPGQWGYDSSAYMTNHDVASFNFNGYHPFVWGLACSTADYRNSYSMPEAWLRYGAGGYVGAVNVAYTTRNGHATRAFFNRWGSNSALSVGYALVDMERDHWGDNSDWKAWTYQHHLFGDPKFGAMTGRVRMLAPAAPDGPIGAVALTLPDYAVTTDEDGLDHVTLPDGGEWLSPTEYLVPTWKVSYTYPQGQRVQNVILTAQSGLTVATGLHIPTHTLAIDCACAAPAMPLQATAAISGWYPRFEQDYAWTLFENPDGTSMLELQVYPFTYNPTTTDVRFYQEWEFAIDVVTTTVTLVDLQPTQATYRLTETVTAALVVHNSGAEQPVIVQPVVKSLSEVVETALPLQTLHAITGTSLLDLVITETLPAGTYALDVTLADMEGHVLDTEVTEFVVGVAAGEVASLAAAPTYFQPGDAVSLAMTFQNTGDVPLDGVAVLRVQSADGVTQTAEFTHTLSALAPGATTTFNDVWTSNGAAADTVYRVVGYVKYALQTSAPRIALISTATPVTGVALSRVGSDAIYPYTLVEFSADIAPDAASKPYSYTVDYGDGQTADGVSSADPLTFTHAFTLTGSYTVAITAWNDALTPPVTDTVQVVVTPTAVCVDVSGVTLSQITGGDLYPDTLVEFSADLAPDDIGKPYTYTVDYGDGVVSSAVSGADPLTLTHTFTRTGVFTVEVAVWNCRMSPAQAVSDTVQVVVTQAAVCVDVGGVTLSQITGGDLYPDTLVEFSADLTPDDIGKPYTYTVDYGDGVVSSAVSGADPLTLTHTFTRTGVFTVEVAVWNCRMSPAQAVSDTVGVTIISRPPTGHTIYLPLVIRNN